MKRKMLPVVLSISLFVLVGCEKAREAAVAINKYAKALDSAQQAEIAIHKAGYIDTAQHVNLQKTFERAAVTGKSLNHSLVTALQGGDPQSQLDAAQASLDAVIDGLQLVKDEQKRAELSLLVTAAKAALGNAIVLIREVKRA